jgi:hypothetical protein
MKMESGAKWMDDLNGLKKEYLDLSNKKPGQLRTFLDSRVA